MSRLSRSVDFASMPIVMDSLCEQVGNSLMVTANLVGFEGSDVESFDVRHDGNLVTVFKVETVRDCDNDVVAWQYFSYDDDELSVTLFAD